MHYCILPGVIFGILFILYCIAIVSKFYAGVIINIDNVQIMIAATSILWGLSMLIILRCFEYIDNGGVVVLSVLIVMGIFICLPFILEALKTIVNIKNKNI